METVEWGYSDTDSLARIAILKVNGKTITGPFHAATVRDDEIYTAIVGSNRRSASINVAAEMLSKTTLDQIGTSIEASNNLAKRLTEKKSTRSQDLNLVYPRIPKKYEVKNGEKKQYHSIPKIDELQISSLAHMQLQCDADIVIPPVPSAIDDIIHFKEILKTTKNEMQTFKKEKPIMGYIPSTDDPSLVINMLNEYLKRDYDCRIFGVDFSGASNNPNLMMAIVTTLRKKLRIKENKESGEKYYLHIFNAAVSKKSVKPVSAVSDLLTHLYGVDSVSGVIWGGGGGVPDHARYIVTGDYGAYRKKAIPHGIKCYCPVCSKHDLNQIYAAGHYVNRLKVHRIATYREEYNAVSEQLCVGKKTRSNYTTYTLRKDKTAKDSERIMANVREIKARSKI